LTNGRRCDVRAAAQLAVECAGQILADHPLGRFGLVGQLGRHRRFDRRPRQPLGQHGKRVPQIDHLVQPRAKEVLGPGVTLANAVDSNATFSSGGSAECSTASENAATVSA
jgi:hypothetical protein